jgi:hypothetical protein
MTPVGIRDYPQTKRKLGRIAASFEQLGLNHRVACCRSPALSEYEDKLACPGNRRYRDCRCNSLDLSGSTTSLTFWANSSIRAVRPKFIEDHDCRRRGNVGSPGLR